MTRPHGKPGDREAGESIPAEALNGRSGPSSRSLRVAFNPLSALTGIGGREGSLDVTRWPLERKRGLTRRTFVGGLVLTLWMAAATVGADGSLTLKYTDRPGQVQVPVLHDIQGKDYLPLSELSQFYGVQVDFDPQTRKILLTLGSSKVKMVLSQPLYLTGEPVLSFPIDPVEMVSGQLGVPPDSAEAVLQALLNVTVRYQSDQSALVVGEITGEEIRKEILAEKSRALSQSTPGNVPPLSTPTAQLPTNSPNGTFAWSQAPGPAKVLSPTPVPSSGASAPSVSAFTPGASKAASTGPTKITVGLKASDQGQAASAPNTGTANNASRGSTGLTTGPEASPQAVPEIQELQRADQDNPPSAKQVYRLRRVVIDAGHGGVDGGAKGFDRGYLEKQATLDIANRVTELLRKETDLEVLMTRRGDYYITLNYRTTFANSHNADLFVSIHCNSNPRSEAHGTETYVYGSKASNRAAALAVARENKGENMVSFLLNDLTHNFYKDRSYLLAGLVKDRIGARLGQHIRRSGIQQAPFYVLARSEMPSVLIETAFISNPTEEKKLKSAGWRDQIAGAIVDGIIAYKERVEASFENREARR